MPVDVGFDEITAVLAAYYRGDDDYLVSTFGDQAPALTGEMGDMLGEMLESDTPFGPLWAEFTHQPDENEAELIGALEVLEESIPEITIRLAGYYAAISSLAQQSGDMVETGDPDDLVDIEELDQVKSIDDGDNDDEYREENAYLRGNVEDRSTSAMYYEDFDSSVEPNQSEDD